MNRKGSAFPIVVLAVLFVGLTLSIMQGMTESSGRASTLFRPKSEAVASDFTISAQPTPTRDLAFTASQLTPILNITSTPAPPPQAEAPTPRPLIQPTKTAIPPVTNFVFTDAVPAADSPEFSADGMGACFSMYTRNRNTAENTCKGEWYPADFAPRAYDQFWCATNAGRVEWVPVRFYDGRGGETVKPYGSLNQCN